MFTKQLRYSFYKPPFKLSRRLSLYSESGGGGDSDSPTLLQRFTTDTFPNDSISKSRYRLVYLYPRCRISVYEHIY